MSNDAASINRDIFNDEAAEYDNKHRKLTERITRELQSRLELIGVQWILDDSDEEIGTDNKERTREVRLLDYACATGAMSRALAQYTTQCVGIDISEKMVALYNKRAGNQGLAPEEMHAIVGDLGSTSASEALSSVDLFNFDIAVVGGGFHHFGDPELIAKRLVERLRPGGILLIWDFLPHGGHHHHNARQGHSHKHSYGHECNQNHENHEEHDDKSDGNNVSHSVMHHGFSEGRMREIFSAAGVGTDFNLHTIGGGYISNHMEQILEDPEDDIKSEVNNADKGRRDVFFAWGSKSAA
ncbi:S-adenosyl-L-methionine-dependent methyltransferase [Xylariaceae sp. FL1019]|nr:S-adenosyl-L-methionine-dependent methyltransferase [Xylariaceae sp. FL1019]